MRCQRGNATAGEFFSGIIDEVRVYNRPLNEGEIRVEIAAPPEGYFVTSPIEPPILQSPD